MKVIWYDPSAAPSISTVSDGGTDTFTIAPCSQTNNNIVNSAIAYVLSAAGGSITITPTFSGSTSAYALFIYEYSGGTFGYDTCTGANSNSANSTVSTLTPAGSGELIVTLLNSTPGIVNTSSIPSGFSTNTTAPADYLNFPVGATYYGDSTDLLSCPSGSNNIGWALNGTGGYAQTNAAFTVSGGGGAGGPSNGLFNQMISPGGVGE